MKNMAGRFFVKDCGSGNPILIGASIENKLKKDHVYEITESADGLHIKDLGVSQLMSEEETFRHKSVDTMLALSGGRHCLVANEK